MEALGFRLRAPGVLPAAILAAMKNDKKKKAGQVRFVLQEALGRSFQQAVDDALVLACIEQGL
jgi:3-dehydroquinate synthetase